MNNKAKYFVFLLIIASLAFSLSACRKKKGPQIEPPAAGVPGEPGEMGEEQPKEPKLTEDTMGGDAGLPEITKQFQPVLFDFNRSDVREDQIPALQNNATVMRKYQNVNVLIEGHCDERGTDEYNLALGERRAKTAKDYLTGLGIPEARLSTISYGETRPFAEGHDEDAWRQNRRAHFVAVKQ